MSHSIGGWLSSGQLSSAVFDYVEDGFGVHLLKCSLISDLYDFVQVLIKEIMKKTIIFTTSMVICVNILHEHLKVYTQK